MKFVKTLLTFVAALVLSTAFAAGKPVGLWEGNSSGRLAEMVKVTVFNPQWHKDKPLTVKFTGKEFSKVSAVVYMHGFNNIFRFREWNKGMIKNMETFVSNGGVLVILIDGAPRPPSVTKVGDMSKLLGATKFVNFSGKVEILDKEWAECGKKKEVFEHMLNPKTTKNKASEPIIALSGLTTAKTIIGNDKAATVTVNQFGKGKVYFVNVRLTESLTRFPQPYYQTANAEWDQYLPFAKKIHEIILSVDPALSKEKREIWDPRPLGPKASKPVIKARGAKALTSNRKYAKLGGKELLLVENGAPKALLIARRVGERGSFEALNRVLEKMSGVKCPLPSPKAVHAKGENWSWQRKLYPTKIEFEVSPKVEIKAEGNTITISAPNSSIGIHTFMREVLGYRMLWPGKDGEVFTKTQVVKVAPFTLSDCTPIRMRSVRNGLVCGKYDWKMPNGTVIQVNSRPGMSKGCDIIGLDVREVIKARAANTSWHPVMRLGGSLNEGGGTNFYPWQAKYGKTKPEVLGLQFETIRKMKTKHVRICKANPETIKLAVKEALENLKKPKNRGVEYYRFSPSDGNYDIMCMCERCRKWDPTGTKMGVSRAYLGQNRPVFRYTGMTDRVLRFTCEAARELQKHKPNMKVVFLAYAGYLAPPQYYHDIPNNILVNFVGGEYLNTKLRDRDRKYWEYWSGVAKELCWRPNFLGGGSGMPLMYYREMAKDLKHFAATGMVGGDFDTLPHHWATNALNYYVLASLLWDPAAEVNDIVDDFCKSGFGDAAEEMKKYYALCAEYTDRYTDLGGISIKELEDLTAVPQGGFGKFCRAFTQESFDKLEKALNDARGKVAADSPERKRIEFVALGLKFFKLNREFAVKYWNTPARDRKKLIPEIDKLVVQWKEIFQEHPFAINLPALVDNYFYEFFRNCGWKPIHAYQK